jgi:SNF2 family DNA or RNA helicase
LYQQILSEVRGAVFDAVKQKGFQSSQMHILAGLMKLRQACNHPALLTKDKDFRGYESTKLDMCMELVDEVVESQRKVLIFSQFTQMLDIVSETLKDRNIQHLYLSGRTRNRQSMVDAFNSDPAYPVFLISLKAGGTGLNLASAETVIIFDPWWNPSVENQAIDRAHRIGQTKTLNVYRLLTIGTIEEKIQALKERKQKLFDAVVGESGDLFKKLTWEDVRELFAE